MAGLSALRRAFISSPNRLAFISVMVEMFGGVWGYAAAGLGIEMQDFKFRIGAARRLRAFLFGSTSLVAVAVLATPTVLLSTPAQADGGKGGAGSHGELDGGAAGGAGGSDGQPGDTGGEPTSSFDGTLSGGGGGGGGAGGGLGGTGGTGKTGGAPTPGGTAGNPGTGTNAENAGAG